MSPKICQHVFGKSTEASWRWCGLCGLPEAVVLLEAAEKEAAKWKANDAASTRAIEDTTIAWNTALRRAEAAEAALVAVRQERTWQPIATAPFAQWVLVWLPFGQAEVAYHADNWHSNSREPLYPTHWMPLPAAPAPAAAEEPR